MTAAGGYAGDGERVTRIVGLAGNPRPQSRTRGLARALTRELTRAIPGAVTAEVDLAPLGPRVLDADDVAASAAVELVLRADLLVVASPTYKAAYSGLLKAFLDRFGSRALAGTSAVPVLLGGADNHRLAVDVHFTPLLLELGALVPARGLFVLESEVADFDAFAATWANAHARLLLTASRASAGPLVTA
jgi:FMN reductase